MPDMVSQRTNQPRQRPSVRAASAQRRQPGIPPFAGALTAVIVVIVLVAAFAFSCSDQPAQEAGSLADGGSPADTAFARVSFVAVGDNLPNDNIGRYADALAGGEGDGVYDYAPIYEPIRERVQSADLAYIDEETHLGGEDIGPQGYPSFNTTDSMADAIVQTGFDLVASATNHSYDWGYFGALDNSLAVWENQPVAFTGTAVTAGQYDRIALVERNGTTFALLNYTYGVNGFAREDLPPYAVSFIDEERMAAQVAQAREQGADVVMVAMHWGTEQLVEADAEQLRLAQYLADLGVDVVLGSHPHVIGPMAWVESSDGSGHRALVAYSLGNFLADHAEPTDDNVLEGMLTCDFVRAEEGGEVTVENVRWVPLVCHSTADQWDFAVYAVDDYPAEMAAQCRAIGDKPDAIGWLRARTAEIVGEEWL